MTIPWIYQRDCAGHYKENKQTKAYLQALESVIGIPITDLFDATQGGNPKPIYRL
jgi:hypothetical protein